MVIIYIYIIKINFDNIIEVYLKADIQLNKDSKITYFIIILIKIVCNISKTIFNKIHIYYLTLFLN